MPTTLYENPHYGALLEPLIKATTLFSFTNQSMSSSNGTVSYTLELGASRRSGFFFLGSGFRTHVALPDSFPGGTFPVAFMCSSIHDFQASLEPPYLVHLLPQPTVQYHHC
ncbi:hypothetical protein C1H46_020055 [Malus baccata]|uniref:Uncharacterized protein n=1 Tax=Malus baccata TaxID=106549 RepID=A0A540M665_MALBA|nr:hypothetical protein C1H46_020055 [Malus baccata]